MPNLYFINPDSLADYSDTANWNTLEDGTGSPAIGVPWTDDGTGNSYYADYDLVPSAAVEASGFYAMGGALSTLGINLDITGSCSVYLGSWGAIYDGTYTHDGFNYSIAPSNINGGLFTGNNGYIGGTMYDGVITGSGLFNLGTILGGTFEITGFTNAGTIDFPNINVTSGGVPFTGTWEGQEWVDGAWQRPKIYWIGGVSDAWEYSSNWNFSADGTGASPSPAPWVPINNEEGQEIDTTYKEYDLVVSPLFTPPEGGIQINGSIGSSVAGTCSLPLVYMLYLMGDQTSVRSGIWTGVFSISGFTSITGGTFTGGVINQNGMLLGGTFSGDSLVIGDDGHGNTTIGLGTEAPTYSFPTLAGGSDQTIARLLHLPWFINL